MLIQYENKNIRGARLRTIEQANEIITEYEALGIQLTLRSLHYQFVSRDLFANTQANYKNLGDTLNDGRLAGLVSWEALEDLTRELEDLAWWADTKSAQRAIAQQYRSDAWANQDTRIEVWIEKDAGVGTIQGVCERNRVPYFACRGNVSSSELWKAGRRFMDYFEGGQEVVVLHIGDLDPSGWDMTRDNERRLSLFAEQDVEVRRIALNIDQVRRYRPPPNPVKMTDSRADTFINLFGHECYELDALEPRVLVQLIQDQIDDIRDADAWETYLEEEREGREALAGLSQYL